MRVSLDDDKLRTMREIAEEVRHPVEAHLWAVLDIMPFAVVVIGSDQRVRGMNARGQAVLREGDAVRFDGSRVRATDGMLDDKLQTALRANVAAVLRVKRLSRKRPLEIAIVPLCGECSALVITDPARAVAAKAERLRSLYGLTPAETRVVAAIVQGEGSHCAASQLGMSVNTLRRHLKSIFHKFDVDRQSQLVRVVAAGCATLDLDSGPNG